MKKSREIPTYNTTIYKTKAILSEERALRVRKDKCLEYMTVYRVSNWKKLR